MPFPVKREFPHQRRDMIAFRKRMDLSQLEAAELAGVSQVTWHYLENGERNPSAMTARRVAKLTGLSAAKMLRLDQPLPNGHRKPKRRVK